jgi:hypothetical protein
MLNEGRRFVHGLRAFLRSQVAFDAVAAPVRERDARREQRFVNTLARVVWPYPAGPYHQLFDAAGIEAGDAVELVETKGLEGALDVFRDAGVYVAYEEFMGTQPAHRGSATFEFSPTDFHNPLVSPDYLSRTGASRSSGTTIPASFQDLRVRGINLGFAMLAWDALGTPSAVWFPVLPSAAGINATLMLALGGNPPERWFSQVAASSSGLPMSKRVLNATLPLAAIGTGLRLPRPRLTTDPAPVLAWARGALARHPRPLLATYPTSAVRLAELAKTEGVRLDGLIITVGGEPLTDAKVAHLAAVGARAINCYGFTQLGGVGMNCPHTGPEEVHIFTQDVVVRPRTRLRPDGVSVEAFCWTRLDDHVPLLAINLENDDFGTIIADGSDCGCVMSQTLRVPTRVRDIRGLSKIVAGGTTLPGEVFERLAEQILPAQFGGSSSQYQFAEVDDTGHTRLVLRIDPTVGPVAEDAVLDKVREIIRASQSGVLATDVWATSGALAVERAAPARTRAGKILPFETLRHD